jgi:hypothetical protein
MATAVMLLHAVCEFLFTVDIDTNQAIFHNLGSFLQLAVTDHEC